MFYSLETDTVSSNS